MWDKTVVVWLFLFLLAVVVCAYVCVYVCVCVCVRVCACVCVFNSLVAVIAVAIVFCMSGVIKKFRWKQQLINNCNNNHKTANTNNIHKNVCRNNDDKIAAPITTTSSDKQHQPQEQQ